MAEHGVYKYVLHDTGEVVYIGKTNSSFDARIRTHASGVGLEAKFLEYKDKCDIFVAHLPNTVETDIMERALINEYKPVLNVADNFDGTSGLIEIKEPQWKPYKPTQEKPIPCVKKHELKPFSREWIDENCIYLGTLRDGTRISVKRFWEEVEGRGKKRVVNKTVTFESEQDLWFRIKQFVNAVKLYGTTLDHRPSFSDSKFYDFERDVIVVSGKRLEWILMGPDRDKGYVRFSCLWFENERAIGMKDAFIKICRSNKTKKLIRAWIFPEFFGMLTELLEQHEKEAS